MKRSHSSAQLNLIHTSYYSQIDPTCCYPSIVPTASYTPTFLHLLQLRPLITKLQPRFPCLPPWSEPRSNDQGPTYQDPRATTRNPVLFFTLSFVFFYAITAVTTEACKRDQRDDVPWYCAHLVMLWLR
jgi:hypothetical protein